MEPCPRHSIQGCMACRYGTGPLADPAAPPPGPWFSEADTLRSEVAALRARAEAAEARALAMTGESVAAWNKAAELEERAEKAEAERDALRDAAGMKLPTQRVLRYVSYEDATDLLGLAQALIDHEAAGKLAKRVCDLLWPGSIVPVPAAAEARLDACRALADAAEKREREMRDLYERSSRHAHEAKDDVAADTARVARQHEKDARDFAEALRRALDAGGES